MSRELNYLFSAVLTVVITANLTAQTDPGTDNLTHSWTFDDGTANDYVGGANGTLMGGAEIDFGALVTTLGDSWMEMPANIISLNTYSEITIESWFVPYSEANTGYHMLVFFGNTINQVGVDYYFFTPARGDDISRAAISCGVETNPWTGESGANGPELDDGVLHHMVSTLSDQEITLYVDGQLTGSAPIDTNNSISKISATYAYLAKSGYDGDPVWLGEILEFNIYNRVLSAEEVLFLYNRGGTGAEDEETGIPGEFALFQNYPNPFNPETRISFDLPRESSVKLKIFDMLGREIAVILDEVKPAGRHNVEFHPGNLSSGIYLYRLDTGDRIFTKKMTLLK